MRRRRKGALSAALLLLAGCAAPDPRQADLDEARAELADPRSRVRVEAVIRLGILAQDCSPKQAAAAIAALRSALDDASPDVRQRAAAGLGDFGPRAAAAIPKLDGEIGPDARAAIPDLERLANDWNHLPAGKAAALSLIRVRRAR